MKKIEILGGLRSELRALSKAARREAGLAITQCQAGFGFPHLHRGIGIRPLAGGFYECRIGLDQRLVFYPAGDELRFVFMGNHDEVQKFLRRFA